MSIIQAAVRYKNILLTPALIRNRMQLNMAIRGGEVPGPPFGGDGRLHRPAGASFRITGRTEPVDPALANGNVRQGPRFAGFRPGARQAYEKEVQLAGEKAQQEEHLSWLKSQRLENIETTRRFASKVPNVDVAVISTKSSAKTVTSVFLGLALAYATDRTTTILDANPDGRVHRRFGHSTEDRLANMRELALASRGIQTERARELRKAFDDNTGKTPEKIIEAQLAAIMKREAEDIRLLRNMRESRRGVGFLAFSDGLTQDDALRITQGGRLFSDYNIYDFGNQVGDVDGDAAARHFVTSADQLIFTVKADSIETWDMVGRNFKRLEKIASGMNQQDGEAFRMKRQNAIIVVSGVDPNMTADEFDKFLDDSKIVDFDDEERKVGGFPFDGPVQAIPFDERIRSDWDYRITDLDLVTQNAFQSLANFVLDMRREELGLVV